jgi:DNA (cytosine-5)-methyltransferase 1
MNLQVFDFFSGCGGTSVGFEQAGLNICFALDNDPDAIQTFRENFPGAITLCRDIREVPVETLSPIIGKRGNPLLFCGCAPCQPFSKQNKFQGSRDSRKDLLSEFSRFVDHWLPECVIIENVPGFQHIKKSGPLQLFVGMLARNRYQWSMGVLAASHFGVPQRRKRFVLVASLVGEPELPVPSHGAKSGVELSTVRDWISGLPPILAGEVHPMDPDHQAAELSPLNLARIKATPEGGGRLNWPKELWLDCHKTYSGHTDVYGRLSWDKQASGLTTRCISFSNGRFGHPEQDRAISLREAACLQTFPREYRFHGYLQSRARQVGNAVPPNMARALADQVLRLL